MRNWGLGLRVFSNLGIGGDEQWLVGFVDVGLD